MFIIICGGGKVGANLATRLTEEGHRTTVIEQNGDRVERLADLFSELHVIHGDACEPVILETAQVSQADAIAAVTGDDEDNLVVCLLARREYNVGTTAARINDPRNEWLFDARFGVDHTISSTRMMAEVLTREVESRS